MTHSNGKHCPVCEGCYDPDHCYACGDPFLEHEVRGDVLKHDPETGEVVHASVCSKCKCEMYVDAPVTALCDYHDEELCVEHGDAYAGGVE